MKAALSAMIEAGLELKDPESALQNLFIINENVISSTLAMPIFCEKYGIAKQFQDLGIRLLSHPIIENIPLDPVPGVHEVLKDLFSKYSLALVTLGHTDLQLEKLKKAGIQPKHFSKIVVGKEKNKKPLYQQILEEFKVDAKDVFVCGDRVPIDLTPAKELGINTIHFVNGRGRVFNQPKEHVDFSISALSELKKILMGSYV